MSPSDPTVMSLESTLVRNFPGLRILDRELELSERFHADLVGIETSGRMVLVILVEGDGDEPLLASLEALAFVRHNAPVLAAHFEEPRLRTDQPPRVLLIAQEFPQDLVKRLRPLQDGCVELFEVRQVTSARGGNLFLAAVGGEPQVLAAAATSEEAFFARLGHDQAQIARECVDRMSRVDDELFLAASASRLAWSFRGRELARVELVGDLLRGSVAPGHEPRALRSPAQVDFFLEEVLGRYVSGLGSSAASPPPAEEAEELPELPGSDESQGSSAQELSILTPEEIRAFQE